MPGTRTAYDDCDASELVPIVCPAAGGTVDFDLYISADRRKAATGEGSTLRFISTYDPECESQCTFAAGWPLKGGRCAGSPPWKAELAVVNLYAVDLTVSDILGCCARVRG